MKRTEQGFTIAEVTKIITSNMPQKFESPGERGNPELFLPSKLRIALRDKEPVARRKTTGKNGTKTGALGAAYSLSDIEEVLNALPAMLPKMAGSKLLPETLPHLQSAIKIFLSEYKRE